MPSWSDLQHDLSRIDPEMGGDHIAKRSQESISLIAEPYGRDGRLWVKNMHMEVAVQKPQKT